MRLILIAALTSITLAGCYTSRRLATVHQRYVLEYECPQDRVQVIDLGGRSVKAKGCGQDVTYYCLTPENCVLEGARTNVAP